VNAPLLVNTLGHSAGVLLFGIFLVLLLQDRATALRRKPMIAAGLALAWNLASLIVLGSGESDSLAVRWTIAIGFAVLSLLPAVLFDLCLGEQGGGLVRAGYALSIVSIIPHVAEVFQPDTNLHRQAMTAIAVGFGILTVVAAFRADGSTRLVGTMSLFLLAMSFVHLGEGHGEQIWSQELAFHHAAIPLALLVLLQDYRFVLLDAFLRVVANGILAAVFVSVSVLMWRLTGLSMPSTPFGLALSLVGACLVLVLFAVARTRVQQMLTRVLFRRPDETGLLNALRVPIRDEEVYLEETVELLGRFVSAPARIAAQPDTEAEAQVPVKTSSGLRFILLGRRTGGRRYLSEDLAGLTRAGEAIAEQLELHHESELRRLISQAELRALQSQIHPHFLFNALNALYGIIPREARAARDTVLNLADIFRYFLDTRKTLVPLSEEMRIVTAYLEIERVRLGEKMRAEIGIAPDALDILIPVLSIQPLVENAVKYGIAPLSTGGVVAIEARRDGDGLNVRVSDTGRGFQDHDQRGVGLENVQRRLELSYGRAAQLDVYSGPQGSTVSMVIPARAAHPLEVAR
jgi:hypothetical protein